MQKLITPYASDFGKPNIVIKHFPDTESYVQILKIENLKNQKVTIYHRLFPEPDKRIFELLLILSRLKKVTKNVELFVPYLPYARQDRENKKGEAVSADVLCGLLKSYGVKKLITYDCHFLPRPGQFKRNGLNIENKSAGKQLMSYAKKYFGKENFVVIAPDEGSSYFTENAQGYSLEKTRKESKATGIKTGIHAEIHKIEGEVEVNGKNVCILDDMISTGGTIIRAIEHLKARGAKKIIVGTVHGIFAGEKIAEKILNNNCDKLFTTNSIVSNDNSKLEIIKLTK
ncbi:MAG: ribose-phosphate diphosphokinase [Candidatus Paceibacterota bacterium]|jgi:ribose-phosphate pyrophosphokinase